MQRAVSARSAGGRRRAGHAVATASPHTGGPEPRGASAAPRTSSVAQASAAATWVAAAGAADALRRRLSSSFCRRWRGTRFSQPRETLRAPCWLFMHADFCRLFNMHSDKTPALCTQTPRRLLFCVKPVSPTLSKFRRLWSHEHATCDLRERRPALRKQHTGTLCQQGSAHMGRRKRTSRHFLAPLLM